MTRTLHTRIPWWGRLESRVVAALVSLGILCVGASGYLAQLTVRYFDTRLSVAWDRGERVVDAGQPLYAALVAAQKRAYLARTQALALELAAVADHDESHVRAVLQAAIAREQDVASITAHVPSRAPMSITADREAQAHAMLLSQSATGARIGRPELYVVVEFLIDTTIDSKYQTLGHLQREIRSERQMQANLDRAIFRVIGLASALVLSISCVIGFLLARTTTRKAGRLSAVIGRVAAGDLGARASELGNDELGQLASAFNHMLDELDTAQRKLAYLQRIGAWQEMARRIAHEIKNPLTPIQLAVQQLRDKDPGTSAEFSRLLTASAEIVEDEVEALRRMVTSFSRFAKVPEVVLEPVDLSSLLDEFARAYGHLTEREQDTLELVLPSQQTTILGDRQLLKQVLVNLVENAVLSAREAAVGSVHVRLSTRDRATSIEIVVEDNGPGIAADRLDSIFEPYETTREHGTGLGLAIVKKIVLDHGGEVHVEHSELGGARFVIELKRVANRPNASS